MKSTIQLVVRLLVATVILLLALPGYAEMTRAECKRNCTMTVEMCAKTCKEHAKNAKVKAKCDKTCKTLGEKCKKECNKRK